MRDRLDTPVLCQGEDTTSALVRRFAEDDETSLFGTLSLWQGVDVPGPSLSLVLIDRIPFPRPDDPLVTARQRAVAAHGGNGFMAVAASHAALLLAQGAGPPAAPRRRPRRGRRAGLADGHRALRRLPAGVAAAVLGDHRPGPGAAGAGAAALDTPVTASRFRVHYPDQRTRERAAGRRRIRKAASMSRRHLASLRGRRCAALLVASCATTLQGNAGVGVRRSVQRGGHARRRRPDGPAATTPPNRRATSSAPTAARSTSSRAQCRQRHRGVLGSRATARRSTATFTPVEAADLVGLRRTSTATFCGSDTYGLVNAGFCLDDEHHRLGPRRTAARPARRQRRHGA